MVEKSQTVDYESLSLPKERRRFNPYFWAVTCTILILFSLTYIVLSNDVFDILGSKKNEKGGLNEINEPDFSAVPELTNNSDFTLNSTLGFGKIYFMELPHRHDRMSAMAMQSSVLNITYEKLDAFNAEPYKDSGYVGMVPTKSAWKNHFMGTSHYGCYQAHVNALRKVIEDNVETALILEGDIAFDVDIKRILTEALPNLDKSYKIHEKTTNKIDTAAKETDKSENATRNFVNSKFTTRETDNSDENATRNSVNSKFTTRETVNSDGNTNQNNESIEENSEPFKINHSDPYQSKKWDIFMLTSCADMAIDQHEDVIYDDELSLGGGTIGTPAGKRRVGRTGGPTCLAAYAVSRAGATKLLTLLSLDSSMPVDLAFKDIIAKRLVKGYTINPSVAGTWVYKPDLGLDGRQSNIDDKNKKPDESEADRIAAAWKSVKENSLSIWEMRYPKNLKNIFSDIRKYVLKNAPNNGLEF